MLSIKLEDWLRHNQWLREAASLSISFFSRLSCAVATRQFQKLARAYELTSQPRRLRSLAARLQALKAFDRPDLWLKYVENSPRYKSSFAQKMTLGRSVILKAPGPNGEKGLLLMTFEYNWAKLMLGLDPDGRKWMDEHFNFVLSTSWSPTDYAVLAMMLATTRGQLFVQACNFKECAAIEAFHPRLTCLKTMPCDWLEPSDYAPKPMHERSIDILMVANWGKFKRHWEFFEVLRQLPSSLKVVLVGQKCDGRSKEFIAQQAREYGVKQSLTLHESVPIEKVASLQCDAKISVIMTRREGCCVAAVESMMAGAALAMRSDAHVGPLAHIGPRTGRRLRPGHLAEDLLKLLEEASAMTPRDWCIENASNKRSRELLEDMLRQHETASGRPWTRGLATPKWHPHPTFADESEQKALKPVYDDLCQRFPGVFTPTLWQTSWQ
jgi:glycosyltransferase involved in cell wall biosynthesis